LKARINPQFLSKFFAFLSGENRLKISDQMVGLKYANLRPLEMFYISCKWAYKCSIPPKHIGFSAFCGQKTSRGNAKNLRVCENFAPSRLNFP
jgi:hypothetical protein